MTTSTVDRKGSRRPLLLTPVAVLLVIIACKSSSGTPVAPDGTQTGMPSAGSLVEYVDPASRFMFAYPECFGRTSTGTNNGFGNRVAAVRFSAFSTAGVGGEAVLTEGPPLIDVQAVGGLYDSIVREALPDRVLAAVDNLLPLLTVTTLCEQLGREDHIDVNASQLRDLTAAQRDALRQADRMGNIRPRVLECAVDSDTVTFRKEAAAAEGGPVRQVFGSVRFLQPPYSSFQIVQARTTSVDPITLAGLKQVVMSWRTR